MILLAVLCMFMGCVAKLAAAEPAFSKQTVEHLGDRYTVVTVRLGADVDVRLYGGQKGGLTFIDAAAAAKRDGRLAIVLTNGGMYRDDHGPVGLFIANGEERHAINLQDGDGNFQLKPNGVFWIDTAGRAHVTVSEAYSAGRTTVRLATQSGPMLLVDGAVHPEFRAESTNKVLRNGVGVSADGKTLHLVISEGGVRFHDFATLFRDPLACDDALFFDGAVSNLWTKGDVPTSRYGAIIAVTRATTR